MSIKSLLVFLDEAEDSDARLAIACELATASNAHVSAVGMTLQVYPYYGGGADGFDATFDVEEFEASRKRAADIASKARDELKARSMSGDARWMSHEAIGLTEAAGRHARHAELAVVGQPVEGKFSSLREAVIDGALFQSGRPLLMLPWGWKGNSPGKSLCVAWDGSKEAARAIHNAIPLIESAESVTVVIVDPVAGTARFGEEPGADIAAVISRHCDNVQLDRVPSAGKSISETLLRRASDAGADVIVMGAYGHSQLRESVFGGVTYDMIHNSKTPLLLSH